MKILLFHLFSYLFSLSYTEAELQNSEECKINGKKDCICKRWELYYGEDPALCLGPLNDPRMLKLLQQPGYELKIDGKYLSVLLIIN